MGVLFVKYFLWMIVLGVSGRPIPNDMRNMTEEKFEIRLEMQRKKNIEEGY